MTVTFIPAAGQTIWYVGGYAASGGNIRFDSLYLAMIPEPSTLFLFGVGGSLLWRWRRRK